MTKRIVTHEAPLAMFRSEALETPSQHEYAQKLLNLQVKVPHKRNRSRGNIEGSWDLESFSNQNVHLRTEDTLHNTYISCPVSFYPPQNTDMDHTSLTPAIRALSHDPEMSQTHSPYPLSINHHAWSWSASLFEAGHRDTRQGNWEDRNKQVSDYRRDVDRENQTPKVLVQEHQISGSEYLHNQQVKNKQTPPKAQTHLRRYCTLNCKRQCISSTLLPPTIATRSVAPPIVADAEAIKSEVINTNSTASIRNVFKTRKLRHCRKCRCCKQRREKEQRKNNFLSVIL